MDERGWDRVRKFLLQYKAGGAWKTILEGATLGEDFGREFAPVRARHVRLNILEASDAPTIWEFKLGSGAGQRATVGIPNSYGLWATTPPVDMKLGEGRRTLRVSTGFQRSVALRWFELRPKGR